ncbi:TonB C-terminal domain-containing protein [Flavobacterium terrisoli]|uniref:TonB C-terminal domain-containing protein n=1 Tax=Flavobacterium terrisoli TaxID=3242195 RepID=UPI00254290E5|nr:TonB C-terminal domain-containing protein [Flavobacterium buctense]
MKLYDSIKKQDRLFDDILFELTKPKRVEDYIDKKNKETVDKFRKQQKDKKIAIKIQGYVLEKKDSVLLKLTSKLDLLETYRKIKAIDIQNLPQTELEKSIIRKYYAAKLSTIDTYFEAYLSALVDNEYTSDKVSTFLNGTPPSLGKCDAIKDKVECLKSKIMDKLSPNFKNPGFREIEPKPVSTIKILINEEGNLSVYKIENSSGHFEYDYQAIYSLLTTFKGIVFTPAKSLGFEDPYYLDIIVNYNQL